MRTSGRSILVIVFFIASYNWGCGRAPENARKKPLPSSPPTLESVIGLTMIPAIDGGMYAVAESDGVVWFIKEDKAVQVKAFPDAFLSDISPSVEGGIYVRAEANAETSLWYIKRTTATKVQEESRPPAENTSSLNSRERWLWALWQQERVKRKAAESERELSDKG